MRISFSLSGSAVRWLLVTSNAAGEYAVLGNGFRMHADRHETDGSVVKLYEDGGVTQIPAGSVDHFEAEEEVLNPAAAVPPSAHAAKRLRPKVRNTPNELAASGGQEIRLARIFRAQRDESRIRHAPGSHVAQRRDRPACN